MINKLQKKKEKNNSIEKFELWRWQFNYRFVPTLTIGFCGRHDLGDVHVSFNHVEIYISEFKQFKIISKLKENKNNPIEQFGFWRW